MVWYTGDTVVVGREAKDHLDLTGGGAPPGFLRSPKMKLRRDGPVFIEGREVNPVDAVAEVLRHIKADALKARSVAEGVPLTRAVMTIPVDFGGPQRRALREAARAAGIAVVQFVHEPVAALYGYLRSRPDYRRQMAQLEGRSVLVFDWGGGTLDLTLCRIQGGAIMQVENDGDNEVGGDEFDLRLMNLLRDRHAAAHKLNDIGGMEQPGMGAKLQNQCEVVKIGLSAPGATEEDVIIRNYLRADGAAQNLVATVSRADLDKECSDLVARGLKRIDDILARARLTNRDIVMCLATGGMVNMPAIADGLFERFVGRVTDIDNGDRIIAEGAAWIAHDGLRLTLSKPIEILVADSSGRGSYHRLVDAGFELPVENGFKNLSNTRLYCVDPREGVAVVEIAKPAKVGLVSPNDPRSLLCATNVPVDPRADPLLERIECHLRIDHDYVVTVTLRSTGCRAERTAEFHDIDFGLSLPVPDGGSQGEGSGTPSGSRGSSPASATRTNLTQRTNVAVDDDGRLRHDDLWRLVPGDLVAAWRESHFDVRTPTASGRQNKEREFYLPCSICGRLLTQIKADPPVEACRGRRCGVLLPPLAQTEIQTNP
ncbi:Hsp70 family protein [Methylobacterium sp. E-016]|uniref:Hsp70 family protein n=1 Tax=Methylobacterium sp. E-016 TaxID=2836556 RepID=UPI001FB9D584|nr:Hsp70 family protein [Methylobacterium sp. E-016]MCJ2077658.1 Hsp70 family protein [Methylobacterium sp. E-016]